MRMYLCGAKTQMSIYIEYILFDKIHVDVWHLMDMEQSEIVRE